MCQRLISRFFNIETTLSRPQHLRLAWTIFFILAAGYLITFFHRTAPAAVAADLMTTFAISATALGSLSAAYFWVYTVMQIPSGILADRVGTRWSVGVGALITAGGSWLFASAELFNTAFAARLLVGLGVSTVFIGLMKACAVWFPPRHYGKISGLAMLLGSCGSMFAAGPLALLLNVLDWRQVFELAALVSLLLALLTLVFVRDKPEDVGLPPVNVDYGDDRKIPLWQALTSVLKIRGVWAAAAVQMGVAAVGFSFAGLWGIPFLQDSFGLSRTAAAGYTTLMIGGAAAGTFIMGSMSDVIGRRKPVIVLGCVSSLLAWLLLILTGIQPGAALLIGFLVFGLLPTGTSVSYAVAKELVPASQAGMAMALVNTGLFFGAALHQPLFGWLLDIGWDGAEQAGRRLYDAADYSRALWLNFGFAVIATVGVLFLPETYCGRSPQAKGKP